MSPRPNPRLLTWSADGASAGAIAAPAAVAAPVLDGASRYTPLQVAWRRRWTVLTTVVLCTAAGLIYITKATPRYTSTSQLNVEQTGPQILSDGVGVVAKQSESYLHNQAALLKSSAILEAAANARGFARMKTFQEVDNVIAYLKKRLRVSVGKQDDLITVAFESPYPEEAPVVVNSIVEEYVAHHASKKKSSATEILRILLESKVKNDRLLEQKMEELVKFKQANGTLSFAGTEGKGNIIYERLAKLSDALTQAELKTFEADAACEAAKQMLSEPELVTRLVEAQQSQNTNQSDKEYGELLAELRKAQTELLSLRQRGILRNASTDELEGRINFTKAQLAEREAVLAQAYVATLDKERQVARAKEADIRKAFLEQEQEALKLNTQSADLVRLESEVKRAEDLSNSLAKRINEVGVDASADSGKLNISVLEVAQRETRPTSPNKPRTMAMALVLGLVLGLGLAFTREWTDHRLRSADEVMDALQLPVLGVVPHMTGKVSLIERGQNVRLQPMSETAEAYRTIRTAVFFAAPGEDMKTILVTSPAPGDGKTTSASNLAIALAQAGHRTLLLDADFRKPTQHKVFQIDPKVGLSSVIAGHVKLREAVRQTETPGLYVLPCGPIPPNPSEILNGKRFAQVMEVLCNAFDRIVLDSPPVMPVTDARILAASADLTILVTRVDKSTERMSRHARDGLVSVGANILGVVVNDMSKRKREGYYGYGYGGYYGRRDSEPAGSDAGGDVAAPVVEPADDDAELRALQVQPSSRRRGHD